MDIHENTRDIGFIKLSSERDTISGWLTLAEVVESGDRRNA
jgi:hypothetical protein